MKSTSMDIPVHDVAPLLEIHDYSLVWFLVLLVCVLVVSYGIVKKMGAIKKTKEVNERQQRYENLIHMDLTNPKKSAYSITKEASFFSQDNEQMKDAYKTLLAYLEAYKYAPNVEAMDKECLALYKAYCQMIVV